MKRISINIFSLWLVVFATTQTSAQSLQELIYVALQNNYQIRITKNEAQMASNNNTLGNAGALPTATVNGGYSNSFNNTRQQFADGTLREGNNAKNTNLNMAALANWTVFNGFSVFAKHDQLGYLEELGQLNAKFYIEQTVSDIVNVYYQLVYESQLLNNYRQSLSISAFRCSIEKKRKEIGVGKGIDYGQALVDYQSDSIRYLAQQNTIRALVVELNRVLNNDLENELSITEQGFPILALPSKDSLFELVGMNNNQLEQQRLRELLAETELRIAKAARYPKVNLYGGYQYTKNTAEVGFTLSNRNSGPTAGISVSFNLYNGGAANRAIKNGEIYTENKQLSKQQVNQNIQANLLNLYNEYYSLVAQINLANSNVETITHVYQTAEEQLKKGAINGYDFRLTQLSLLNANLTLMQLQFSLKVVEVNLNRLSGKVVTAYVGG